MSGVYLIVCKPTCKTYVGSTSSSITRRWNNHKSNLRRNKHGNPYLQHAWNKYGETKFEMILIEEADNNILETEQWYPDHFKTHYHNGGFNIAINAEACCRGIHLSKEHKEKIRQSKLGRTHGKKTREKMRRAKQGVKAPLSKLQPKDVISIRNIYESGEVTQASLAKQFNVSEGTISLIINRKTWIHVK